jgi:hypothetical protein
MNEKSILDIEVSTFSSYKGTIPKNVNLLIWLQSLKYENKVNTIRKTNDVQLIKKLKSELPAITPSGTFKLRKADELILHSGFLQFDIDFKDNLHIKNYTDLRNQISNLSEVAFCGLSVSGNGFWGLVPISDPKKHKEHFEALYLVFKNLGITIDKSCKDVCRLRGYSIDLNGYYNHKASIFSLQIDLLSKKKMNNNIKFLYPNNNIDGTKKNVEICLNTIQNRFIDITGTYEDWFSLGCSIANEFGENGREYYHRLSNISNKYNYQKTEIQFTHCLKNNYDFNIGTFFHFCKLSGIDNH